MSSRTPTGTPVNAPVGSSGRFSLKKIGLTLLATILSLVGGYFGVENWAQNTGIQRATSAQVNKFFGWPADKAEAEARELAKLQRREFDALVFASKKLAADQKEIKRLSAEAAEAKTFITQQSNDLKANSEKNPLLFQLALSGEPGARLKERHAKGAAANQKIAEIAKYYDGVAAKSETPEAQVIADRMRAQVVALDADVTKDLAMLGLPSYTPGPGQTETDSLLASNK